LSGSGQGGTSLALALAQAGKRLELIRGTARFTGPKTLEVTMAGSRAEGQSAPLPGERHRSSPAEPNSDALNLEAAVVKTNDQGFIRVNGTSPEN